MNNAAPSFTKALEPEVTTELVTENIVVSEDKPVEEIGNPTLAIIIEEIKALRKEILEIKKGKNELPKVEEDPEQNEKIRKTSERISF